MCSATSSTMLASRVGSRFRRARRLRTSSLKSGIFNLRDAIDGGHKGLPCAPLRAQNFFPLGREPIVTAATLLGFIHPAAFNPTALFQPIEQRIQRRTLKRTAPSERDSISLLIS